MTQKHTTIRNGKRLLWYTERLWREAESLEPFELDISSIKELDQNCWFDSREPTLREVSKHFARIQSTELEYPIILNEDGSLMDGGHRLCKALLQGHSKVLAVQFPVMPEPDEVSDVVA
jgi:hypothetical protein